MQITTHSFQLPQYQSALLKKQRQSKVLSPKVTHVYPEISSIQKIKLKKHHLDDTEMKLALQYDYEENHLPKQYLFKGDRLGYDKGQYNSGGGKRSNRKMSGGNNHNNSNGFGQTAYGNLNLNTEYFQTHHNFNPIAKPQRDINQYQTQNHQQPLSRLKKSLSIPDLQTFNNNQHLLQHQVIPKLNQISKKTQRISKNIQQIQSKQKQKSAHKKEDVLGRYRSQGKGDEGERRFGKLKERLQRERTKEKRRLEEELAKLKEETKKIKEEERKRKKSFKQMAEKHQQQYQLPNSKYLQNLMLSAAQNNPTHYNTNRTTDMHYVSQRTHLKQTDPLIDQKLTQLQRKYLPKTNIVNKRIQCEIYDPRSDHVKRLQEKPRFRIGDKSETDSQFSDF